MNVASEVAHVVREPVGERRTTRERCGARNSAQTKGDLVVNDVHLEEKEAKPCHREAVRSRV